MQFYLEIEDFTLEKFYFQLAETKKRAEKEYISKGWAVIYDSIKEILGRSKVTFRYSIYGYRNDKLDNIKVLEADMVKTAESSLTGEWEKAINSAHLKWKVDYARVADLLGQTAEDQLIFKATPEELNKIYPKPIFGTQTNEMSANIKGKSQLPSPCAEELKSIMDRLISKGPDSNAKLFSMLDSKPEKYLTGSVQAEIGVESPKRLKEIEQFPNIGSKVCNSCNQEPELKVFDTFQYYFCNRCKKEV